MKASALSESEYRRLARLAVSAKPADGTALVQAALRNAAEGTFAGRRRGRRRASSR
jgi:hypothetical protein